MGTFEDLTVDSEKNVTIELYYKRSKSHNAIQVIRNIDDIPIAKRSEYKKVTFDMRPLSWGLYNAMQRESTVDKGMPGERIDWTVYKEKKIHTILVGWDAIDNEEKPVPLNSQTIQKLHPVLVETLLNVYDQMNFLGEDDTKKS